MFNIHFPTRRPLRRARFLAVPLLAVALLIAGQPAGASNIGGGATTGTVNFTNAGGVPPLFANGNNTTFNLSGSVPEGFVLNTVGTEYVGPISYAGFGSSVGKEGAQGGTGLLTIAWVSGNGPTGGSLYCSNLVGTYIRVTAVVTALLNGVCTVNNFSAQVTFVFVGEFEPVGSGAGTSQPIYTANYKGTIAVLPAG